MTRPDFVKAKISIAEVDELRARIASLESERDQLRSDLEDTKREYLTQSRILTNYQNNIVRLIQIKDELTSERDQLRKYMEGFVAGMNLAVQIAKASGNAAHDAILSAASALEQKEQG